MNSVLSLGEVTALLDRQKKNNKKNHQQQYNSIKKRECVAFSICGEVCTGKELQSEKRVGIDQ